MRARPEATSAASAPRSAPNLFSYYRQFAVKCQTAARNAPTEKQRVALQEMVRVWREFAAEHELMVQRAGTDRPRILRNRAIPGWV